MSLPAASSAVIARGMSAACSDPALKAKLPPIPVNIGVVNSEPIPFTSPTMP
jgi:hypothetical protein